MAGYLYADKMIQSLFLRKPLGLKVLFSSSFWKSWKIGQTADDSDAMSFGAKAPTVWWFEEKVPMILPGMRQLPRMTPWARLGLWSLAS